MRIRRIGCVAVRIPFVPPVRTARVALGVRETTLVRLDLDGAIGYGEGAAWPGFIELTNEEIAREISSIVPGLVRKTAADARAVLGVVPLSAPARCALDMALLDAERRAQGKPFLAPRRESVAVNTVIDAIAPADVTRLALAARERGFLTFKLKVGGAPEHDVARVAALRAAVGNDASVRLDANGAWSERDAVRALLAFAPYGISYVEQPVSADGDLAEAVAALARVRSASPIPIAADELARDRATTEAIIAARAADVLILKLSAIGGVGAMNGIVALAQAADMRCVITTMFESGIGTAAALFVAAVLPNADAAGLSTAARLENDLTAGEPAIVRGAMRVPLGGGLGVVPQNTAVERYRVRDVAPEVAR